MTSSSFFKNKSNTFNQMRSGLYQGNVYHGRKKCISSTIDHSFTYPVWMALLDLDEIEAGKVPDSFWCSFSPGKLSVTKWRRSDYFGEAEESLSKSIKSLVENRTGLMIRKVWLLTNLSFLGVFNFNPVSVYYCFNSEEQLCAAVLEVSNTPWLDKRIYVLKIQHENDLVCWEKDFHVSPFMDKEHDYIWDLSTPGEKLVIHAISKRRNLEYSQIDWTSPHVSGDAPCTFISRDSIKDHPTSFVVRLDCRRVELKDAAACILSNPCMPLEAVLWIHIEALKVWWNGVSYVNPPPKSRQLGTRDALKHLLIFSIAFIVRYGVVVPVQAMKQMFCSLLLRFQTI